MKVSSMQLYSILAALLCLHAAATAEIGHLGLFSELIAYYPFDSSADDFSGNRFHCIPVRVNNDINMCEMPNKAYGFSQLDAYVMCGDRNEFRLTGPLSLSFLIRAPSLKALPLYRFKQSDAAVDIDEEDELFRYVLDKHSAGKFGYYAELQANGKLLFRFGTSDIVSQTNIADGKWKHVIVVVEPRGLGKIFVNGQVEQIKQLGAWNYSTDSLVIGNGFKDNKPAGPLRGAIDELRIFRKKLSDEEAQWLYKLDTDCFKSNIGSFGNMQQFPGNILADNINIPQLGALSSMGGFNMGNTNFKQKGRITSQKVNSVAGGSQGIARGAGNNGQLVGGIGAAQDVSRAGFPVNQVAGMPGTNGIMPEQHIGVYGKLTQPPFSNYLKATKQYGWGRDSMMHHLYEMNHGPTPIDCNRIGSYEKCIAHSRCCFGGDPSHCDDCGVYLRAESCSHLKDAVSCQRVNRCYWVMGKQYRNSVDDVYDWMMQMYNTVYDQKKTGGASGSRGQNFMQAMVESTLPEQGTPDFQRFKQTLDVGKMSILNASHEHRFKQDVFYSNDFSEMFSVLMQCYSNVMDSQQSDYQAGVQEFFNCAHAASGNLDTSQLNDVIDMFMNFAVYATHRPLDYDNFIKNFAPFTNAMYSMQFDGMCRAKFYDTVDARLMRGG